MIGFTYSCEKRLPVSCYVSACTGRRQFRGERTQTHTLPSVQPECRLAGETNVPQGNAREVAALESRPVLPAGRRLLAPPLTPVPSFAVPSPPFWSPPRSPGQCGLGVDLPGPTPPRLHDTRASGAHHLPRRLAPRRTGDVCLSSDKTIMGTLCHRKPL